MIDTAKERVQDELKELSERIDKLDTFLASNKYDKLRDADKLLLKLQLRYMKKYADILSARLSVWKSI